MVNWTSPQTWLPKDIVTAIQLNAQLSDNQTFLAEIKLEGQKLSTLSYGTQLRLRLQDKEYSGLENTTNSTSLVQVGTYNVTLTTRGGPVVVIANFEEKSSDGSRLETQLRNNTTTNALGNRSYAYTDEYRPNSLVRIDGPLDPGTFEWILRFRVLSGSVTGYIRNVHLMAFEIA